MITLLLLAEQAVNATASSWNRNGSGDDGNTDGDNNNNQPETVTCNGNNNNGGSDNSGGNGSNSGSSGSNTDPGAVNPAYGYNYVTPEMGVAGAVLIFIGLFLLLAGVRAHRLTLGISGFLTIGTLAWIALANSKPVGGYSNDSVVMVAVPAGLGVFGAIVYVLLPFISKALVSAMGGLALAAYICCWQENLVIDNPVGRAFFVALLPVLFAVAFIFLREYAIVFSTSFTGAFVFLVGIDFYAHTGLLAGIESVLNRQYPYDAAPYTITTNVYVLLVVTAICCVISLAWQYLYIRNVDNGPTSAKQPESSSSDHHAASRDVEEAPAPTEAPARTAAATGAPTSSATSAAGDHHPKSVHSCH